MSSRRDEKEQRRAERVAAEEQAQRAERRRRTLGIATGAVLGIAAVAAVVVVLAAGGGGGDKPKPATTSTDARAVAIPPPAITDLQAAIRAAGCRLRSFAPGPNDGQHVKGKVAYKQNPPALGPHNQVPSSDGNYVGQGTPPTEMLVHALEHARVEIQYRPGLPQRRISQLETLFAEPIPGKPAGFKQLLFENQTKMPFEVAATSWGQQLGCPRFTDKTFDALRAFRAKYVEKAPENPPFPE